MPEGGDGDRLADVGGPDQLGLHRRGGGFDGVDAALHGLSVVLEFTVDAQLVVAELVDVDVLHLGAVAQVGDVPAPAGASPAMGGLGPDLDPDGRAPLDETLVEEGVDVVPGDELGEAGLAGRPLLLRRGLQHRGLQVGDEPVQRQSRLLRPGQADEGASLVEGVVERQVVVLVVVGGGQCLGGRHGDSHGGAPCSGPVPSGLRSKCSTPTGRRRATR